MLFINPPVGDPNAKQGRLPPDHNTMPFIHPPVGDPTVKRGGHPPDHTTICLLIVVVFLFPHLMQLFPACFFDRGTKSSSATPTKACA